MSQPKRVAKTEGDDQKLTELMEHIEGQYHISKDIFLKEINRNDIQYKLGYYNINLADLDNEIEANNMNNEREIISIDTIVKCLDIVFKNAEKKEEENKIGLILIVLIKE